MTSFCLLSQAVLPCTAFLWRTTHPLLLYFPRAEKNRSPNSNHRESAIKSCDGKPWQRVVVDAAVVQAVPQSN